MVPEKAEAAAAPPPEWVEAVQAALGRLRPPHVEKKKTTIIALVDARVAGKSEESIWSRADVCARSTYHLRWKFDETFAAALAEVDELARGHKDAQRAGALHEAAEKLILASPHAAQRAVDALDSEDENVRLRASFGVLDRASKETAKKGPEPAGRDVGDLTDEQLERIIKSRGGTDPA